jgi:hypothetical protein
MKHALTLIALLGCNQAEIDRARDCDAVRKIVEENRLPTAIATQRQWDYSQREQPARLRDETQFDRLRKLHYRDPEVRDAVNAMVDETGFQFYSPYRRATDAPSAADRLAKLCGMQRLTIVETN